jgi:hypothetical protein
MLLIIQGVLYGKPVVSDLKEHKYHSEIQVG